MVFHAWRGVALSVKAFAQYGRRFQRILGSWSACWMTGSANRLACVQGTSRSHGQSATLVLGAATSYVLLSAKHFSFHQTSEEVVLKSQGDPYGGIAVDPTDLPVDEAVFCRRIDKSLHSWRSRSVRGVWLKIPIDKSHLISHAVERNFVFHHAERNYCMLTTWLPTDEPNPLPPNTSTQVGVGALVVNEDGQVLLVQEAVGPAAGKNIWKIPTGLLNAREDIKDGVIRECFEETGLHAHFEKVIAFRHAHTAMFGKSDLFIVCLLSAKSRGTALKLQAGEISQAKWADFNEFLQQAPYPRDTPVWASLYGHCVGNDGVVGNVPGIKCDLLPLTKQASSNCQYIYYA